MVQKVALKPQNYVPQLPIITAPSRKFIIQEQKLYNLAEVRNVCNFDRNFFERFLSLYQDQHRFATMYFFFKKKWAQTLF